MDSNAGDNRPKYVAPTINVLDESEVLKSFQITASANTWWTT